MEQAMNIGVVFPQTEFGHEPENVQAYVQAAESLGFSHILAFDHVLGADPTRHKNPRWSYTYEDPFLEPFVLFSFMAAQTERIEFVTGVLILPQRQTALVAKQAATLDLLSGERLRLGVGLGWNRAEYLALDKDFHTRGARMEEQVNLLRALWRHPLIEFDGEWESIHASGLNPLPTHRTIPIWFGGYAEPALERAARLGDGWISSRGAAEEMRPTLERLRHYLNASNREPASFGIEAIISYGDGNPDQWRVLRDGWLGAGASHLSVNTMRAGLQTPDEHVHAIGRVARALL
jgi:probable F420-dependent oxidoreductase